MRHHERLLEVTVVDELREVGERAFGADEAVVGREQIVERGHALVQGGSRLFGQHGVVHEHVFLSEQLGPEPQRAVRVLPRALERLREREISPARVHETVKHAARRAHGADLHDEVAARGALGALGHARLVPGHDGRLKS